MPDSWACYNLAVLILKIFEAKTVHVVKIELEKFFLS